MQKALKWFFTNKQGKVVIFQMPNLPINIWGAFTLLGFFVKTDSAHKIIGLVAFLSLVVWAVLEIVSGVSNFRRTLGAVVLILTIMNRL